MFQQLDLVSPFQLYFNPILIVTKYQIWRVISTFLFFGNLGFNFFFNMIFTYRYCRMLEEGSFRGRTADFVVMFIFGGVLMIVSFTLVFILRSWHYHFLFIHRCLVDRMINCRHPNYVIEYLYKLKLLNHN